MSAEHELTEIILRPFLREEQRLRESKMWLAHYTTAENALNIINNGVLWLRQPVLMNDSREIDHGHACMRRAVDDYGARLKDALSAAPPGVLQRAAKTLDEHIQSARHLAFVASLCEHHPEDRTGTLSMWRAYGGKAGVAFIIDPARSLDTPEEEDSDTHLAAANYCDPESFAPTFEELVADLEARPDLLRAVDPAVIEALLAARLEFSIYTAKHAGFSEEREWRLIYRSVVEKQQKLVSLETESIAGIPQIVAKMPLVLPGKAEYPASLDTIIERVIVGPSPWADEIALGISHRLSQLGFTNPHERVIASNIPLRVG